MAPVRLTIVPNEIEAEQVRSLLRFEGIESMQRLTDFAAASHAEGAVGMGGPREILVSEKDLEVALALISEIAG